MSLINEALKKAQRQRMEDPVAVPAPSATAAESTAPRIAKRRPPMPASTLILLLGGGGAVVVMAGVFAYLFLLPDAPPPAPIKSRVAAAAPASPVAPAPAPTPAPAAPAPAPVEVAITLPPITPPVTKPVAPTPVAPPVQATPVVSTPAPAAPKPTLAIAATPTANPKVYEFLETLRIAGIRVSATDPKVIMNDRVFRLNDLVDRNTQLRLLKVETATLIFVDPSGYEYRKNF